MRSCLSRRVVARDRRHFLSTEDFTRAEITGILDLAVRFAS